MRGSYAKVCGVSEHPFSNFELLSSHRPNRKQVGDIRYGQMMMAGLADVPVGASIAVRRADILAVEASEGPIGLIEHAAAICRQKGWALITSNEVTMATIHAFQRGKGGMIVLMPSVAVDADVIDEANRAGIVMVRLGEAAGSEPDDE